MTQQPWCDVGRHQRAFDQQCAAAAHRIEQRAAFGIQLRPAAAQQHGRSEVLLQRRLALRLAPAAPVQWSAAEIDRKDRPALAHHQVEAQVGRFDIDIRPRAGLRAQHVDDGVLDALCGITRVRDRIAGNMGVDGQRHARIEMLLPRHRCGAGVERVLVGAVVLGQRPEDAARQARPQHGALRIGERAFDIGAGHGRGRARAAEREQFVGEQVFEAFGAGGEEFQCLECIIGFPRIR